MTARGDNSAKTAPAPHRFDPATMFPHSYALGQTTANKIIGRGDLTYVRVSLAIVRDHLENWPAGQTKLPDTAWAMEKGFADTLEEYIQEVGS